MPVDIHLAEFLHVYDQNPFCFNSPCNHVDSRPTNFLNAMFAEEVFMEVFAYFLAQHPFSLPYQILRDRKNPLKIITPTRKGNWLDGWIYEANESASSGCSLPSLFQVEVKGWNASSKTGRNVPNRGWTYVDEQKKQFARLANLPLSNSKDDDGLKKVFDSYGIPVAQKPCSPLLIWWLHTHWDPTNTNVGTGKVTGGEVFQGQGFPFFFRLDFQPTPVKNKVARNYPHQELYVFSVGSYFEWLVNQGVGGTSQIPINAPLTEARRETLNSVII